MYEVRISLSPAGGIRLQVPDQRRSLDIPLDFAERIECPCCGERSTVTLQAQALRMLKRLLKDAAHTDPEPGYIGPFPTQAIVDAWLADDRNKVSNEETRKAAVEAKRLREEKTRLAEKGIDIDALEFKL